jgi:hypothetical protein
MFGEQRSRLALLSVFGALLVPASPAAAQTDPTLPPDCQRAVEFDPGQFSNPTQIDNRFLPLTPGNQLVLEGVADRGPGVLPHTVTFTVTDLVKVIDGVPSLVMWDVDENEGEIVEAELAFFAQDDAGNVWNLGEYPEEYEDGFFLGAPNTWIAGVADAEGGIHMLANRRVGDSYLQGFAPEIDFLDCATVERKGARECDIPAAGGACYRNVLVTHERSPLDPGNAIQTKSHAPRVGIVKVGAINDPEGETLVLREIRRLDQPSMAAARGAALALDQRAYGVSEVYCETEPMAPNPPTACTVPQPFAPVSPPVGAPTAPAAPATPPRPRARKAGSRPKSCYAKRSRRSARRMARRRARRVATRRGARAVLRKMPRKTCADLITRR